jgi:3-phenylpropionate/cinnamic acid dioxygenase small subunit
MHNGDLQREVEQFLYREALLIDERRLDDWLALFADEALYWIPSQSADSDPSQEGPIVCEGRDGIALRVARLQHPSALHQVPPPRTRHFITNVLLQEASETDVRVASNQLVYAIRGRTETHWPGVYEHTLRRVDGEWRIARKKVYILTNDQPLRQIPIL